MKRLLCIALLLGTAPTVAFAQSLAVGSLVRISTEGQPVLQGLVSHVGDEWIEVDRVQVPIRHLTDITHLPVPVRVPINSITDLQVRGRRGNAGKGALIGGVSLGALSGLGLAWACGTNSGFFNDCPDQVLVPFMFGASVGFAAGALLGAMIGSMIMSDAWEPVALDGVRVTIAPSRSGSMSVGLSLSF